MISDCCPSFSLCSQGDGFRWLLVLLHRLAQSQSILLIRWVSCSSYFSSSFHNLTHLIALYYCYLKPSPSLDVSFPPSSYSPNPPLLTNRAVSPSLLSPPYPLNIPPGYQAPSSQATTGFDLALEVFRCVCHARYSLLPLTWSGWSMALFIHQGFGRFG